MNLILLGGNSISNKEWIEEVESHLKPLFATTKIHYYQHWKDGKDLIDIDEEIKALQGHVKDLPEYMIFAKSAGTVVVRDAINKNLISPAKCVFVGLPVLWEKEAGFGEKTGFEDYSVPTLFIQKTSDPKLSFEGLVSLIREKNIANHSLKEVPGDDHYYGDMELLREEVKKFK